MDQAVSRALRLLEVLGRSGAPMRMSAIALEAGLQKSTTHRILQTLVALGYVEQEGDTGRYGPSLKMWELGSGVVVGHPVKRMAAPFLQSLHDQTAETVSLLLRSGDDVLYLDKIISPRAVRFSTRPGSRAPAPLTAGGKAILAAAPDGAIVAERLADRLKGRSDFTLDRFLAELDQTRARGYAVNRHSPGVVSFGCAIRSKVGPPTAAFSVSAPEDRLDANGEARLADALLSTCARLVETAGFL